MKLIVQYLIFSNTARQKLACQFFNSTFERMAYFFYFFVSQMHQGMELGVSYVRIVINSSKAQMTIV
jgi:hypothetical protein